MAAGEEELEPLVWDRRLLHLLLRDLRWLEQPRLLSEDAPAANPVNRAVPRGHEEPGARVLWRPVSRPALRCRRERLLGGLLGQVEVAEEADERRDDAAPLLPEGLLENP